VPQRGLRRRGYTHIWPIIRRHVALNRAAENQHTELAIAKVRLQIVAILFCLGNIRAGYCMARSL
jgi:hypothetical protein